MTMINEMRLEEFLKLPVAEIQKIVDNNKKPKTGVFIADGSRRYVMSNTELSPGSDAFYIEYAHFFVQSLKRILDIFFDHGLKMLFFPLFGPSLLIRKNKFQFITIPEVYKKIFKSEEWLDYYNEKSIRVKTYGDLSRLCAIDPLHLEMEEGISETVAMTEKNSKHTVFFGFMSDNNPGFEMPGQVINFYRENFREPTPEEMIEIYYRENIPPVDFLIFSNKLSGHRAVPPFITSWKAKAYFFPVPGFFALTVENYRRIIYDLIFVQQEFAPAEYSDNSLAHVSRLRKFYDDHKNTIIGIGERLDGFCIPEMD